MLSSTGSNTAFHASDGVLSGEKFYWKVVSLVTKDRLRELKTAIFFNWLPYLVILLIIILFLSLALCLIVAHRNQALEERLQKEKLQGVLEMAGAVFQEMNEPVMCISGY